MLALIPARGGSKRLPGKNIKDFHGQPLLAWTIAVAEKSGLFDRIVLSTDDEAIATVGRRYGAEVPFLRPAELAADTSPVIDAIRYTLECLHKLDGYQTDWFFLLEPSSPGRQPEHLREVAEIIRTEGDNFDSVVGVSKIPANQTPPKALQIFAKGELKRPDGTLVKNLVHRTQDIPDFYYINSALYAFRVRNLTGASPSLWGERVRAYPLAEKYAMDIDTADDWLVAEAKMAQLLPS